MVVGNKNHQKQLGTEYKKILNKHDPLDRLILDLGKHGVLDVNVVNIEEKAPGETYTRESVPHRGKHTS